MTGDELFETDDVRHCFHSQGLHFNANTFKLQPCNRPETAHFSLDVLLIFHNMPTQTPTVVAPPNVVVPPQEQALISPGEDEDSMEEINETKYQVRSVSNGIRHIKVLSASDQNAFDVNIEFAE